MSSGFVVVSAVPYASAATTGSQVAAAGHTAAALHASHGLAISHTALTTVAHTAVAVAGAVAIAGAAVLVTRAAVAGTAALARSLHHTVNELDRQREQRLRNHEAAQEWQRRSIDIVALKARIAVARGAGARIPGSPDLPFPSDPDLPHMSLCAADEWCGAARAALIEAEKVIAKAEQERLRARLRLFAPRQGARRPAAARARTAPAGETATAPPWTPEGAHAGRDVEAELSALLDGLDMGLLDADVRDLEAVVERVRQARTTSGLDSRLGTLADTVRAINTRVEARRLAAEEADRYIQALQADPADPRGPVAGSAELLVALREVGRGDRELDAPLRDRALTVVNAVGKAAEERLVAEDARARQVALADAARQSFADLDYEVADYEQADDVLTFDVRQGDVVGRLSVNSDGVIHHSLRVSGNADADTRRREASLCDRFTEAVDETHARLAEGGHRINRRKLGPEIVRDASAPEDFAHEDQGSADTHRYHDYTKDA